MPLRETVSLPQYSLTFTHIDSMFLNIKNPLYRVVLVNWHLVRAPTGEFYNQSIRKVMKGWHKGIILWGEYIEKD